MHSADGFGYSGEFRQGSKEGIGKLFITNGSYILDATFKENRPENFPNEVQFELISPIEHKEEVVDPKAKKDPKA